jgi:molecular chaperone GrpE
MNGNEKDMKKDAIANEPVIKEDGTLEIDEESLQEEVDLQKLAEKLGNEHAKTKERRFFGRKNKDSESSHKIEQLKEQLKEKDEKIKELDNNVKILVAENRNQKTRIENEFRTKIRFAAEDFFRDFITVKDDFDKAMEFVPSDENAQNDPFIQGIRHLLSKTESIMKKHGLECFSGIGEKFDPSIHQAMSMIPVEGREQNEIVAEYVKGYKMNDRILRPAMVIVASGVNPATETESDVKEEEKPADDKADDENIEQ